MILVIFAVCMVSYSGPMIKGALAAGATPASVAFLRLMAAALLITPLEAVKCRQKKYPLRLSRREAGLTVLSAIFLALHYLPHGNQHLCLCGAGVHAAAVRSAAELASVP